MKKKKKRNITQIAAGAIAGLLALLLLVSLILPYV
jgi:hypothetical protein